MTLPSVEAWGALSPLALEELRGFPARYLPALPTPLIMATGGARRLITRDDWARIGIDGPSKWLRSLEAEGRPDATTGELCALYGSGLVNAWWPKWDVSLAKTTPQAEKVEQGAA